MSYPATQQGYADALAAAGGDASRLAISSTAISVLPSAQVYERDYVVPDMYSVDGLDATGSAVANAALLNIVSRFLALTAQKGIYRFEGLLVDKPLSIAANGATFKTSKLSDKVLWIGHNYAPIYGARIAGLVFSQPNDPGMDVGVKDNHFCLSLWAVIGSVFSDLRFDSPDLCISIGMGSVNVPDRASVGNVISGVVGRNVRGMGIEIFGSRAGVYNGLAFAGTNGAGGRAKFHGVRLQAYNTTPNRGNVVEATATGFNTGLSIQRHSHCNAVRLHADNCTQAAQVHTSAEGVTAEDVSTCNHVTVTASSCNYAVYTGGTDNIFEIAATGCTSGGVLEMPNGGVIGLSMGNTFRGVIRATAGRLADLRGSDGIIDLQLRGVGAASTYGLLVQGSGYSGSAKIYTCAIPFKISGSDNMLSVTIKDCTAPADIAGSGNDITIRSDGAITISGNNNVLRGIVKGPVTNTGAGNDLSGLRVL